MLNPRLHAVAVTILLSTAAMVDYGDAQRPPWPDGCSVGAPLFVQNGLNGIFLDACNEHDRCWAKCNGPHPPHLDLVHKAVCDVLFLTHMETACLFWAGVLSFPGSGWIDADEFLEHCTAVALTFTAAVNAPPAVNIYWRSQCLRGCNPNGCANAGIPQNPLCGIGQCYVLPPVPCSSPMAETKTWLVWSNEEPVEALEQLGFALDRSEQRPETSVYVEEWAVLSVDDDWPTVTSASTEEFGARVANSGVALSTAEAGAGAVVVVEAAEHSQSFRHIPIPRVLPFEVELGQIGGREGERIWFRAEVASDGDVDQVTFLDSLDAIQQPLRSVLSQTIAENLQLDYADEKRHRTVVFGLATLKDDGHFAVRHGLVIVPQCCQCSPPGCPPFPV